VECLKRALLGADRHEITINSKLAKLHEELEEAADAVAYHRRVIDICCIEGATMLPLGFFVSAH
jgi:anaphase-promoting complex subunit 8